VLTKLDRGQFDLEVVCSEYVDYVKSYTGSSPEEEYDFKRARARTETLKGDKLEIEIGKEKKALIKSKQVDRILSNVIIETRNNIRSIPDRLSHRLVGHDDVTIHEIMLNEIDDSLRRLADSEKLKAEMSDA